MKYPNDTTKGEQSPDDPESIHEIMQVGLDMKLHVVQHHAQMAFLLAEEILCDEKNCVTSEKYERNKPLGGRFRRWGMNPGSVRIDGERIPIRVPRARDVEASRARPLESYQHLKKGIDIDEKLEKSILLGLSTRDYTSAAEGLLGGFGLSQSSVSRAFQECSAKALETFEERRFDKEDFAALWIEGKYLVRQGDVTSPMVNCMHLTGDGRKIAMGFVETTTENFDGGILCIIDGSKGRYKGGAGGLRRVRGPSALPVAQERKRDELSQR